MSQSKSGCKNAQAEFSRFAKPLVDEALAHAAQGEPSPDDFHKLRVALRRLRTLIWAWRPLLGRKFADLERAYLKRPAAAAGEARDWDIAISLLGDEQTKPDTERLQTARRDARARASSTLAAADLKHALREMLRRVNRELNTSPRRTPIKCLARERVRAARRALRKRMRRAQRANRGDYAPWHEVRKGAKRLRYLLEFFQPVLRRRESRRVKSLRRLQDRFGALNDAVATEHLLGQHREVFADAATADAALAALKRERKRRRRAARELLG
ncbi:CHAD domain-containing protein [Paraburkholderia unamae]|uniref:CHAD domain-containing protein n=1 Tax=Paraburkholderia unamae TaxID=219649 RepID=A0ABX5K973_9BURK|nr:CHAD domain-containing protein [Paraburkholderia unamae]PVX61375.1 CHAD domain-containing protein [Paraburkholderia unamae]RAR49303.1 CHAD domain-containing protein [Paraburkholderia unamae]